MDTAKISSREECACASSAVVHVQRQESCGVEAGASLAGRNSDSFAHRPHNDQNVAPDSFAHRPPEPSGRVRIPARPPQDRYSKKLTAREAREIREKRVAGKSANELAREYGVGSCYVRWLCKGKTWKEAGGPLYVSSAPRLSRFGRDPIPPHERMVKYVDRSDPDGCWPWTGLTDKDGYGILTVGSLVDGTKGNKRAHVLAWELANGRSVPDGLIIRHVVCGNTSCCRPDHLAPGTHKQNGEDKVRMGRSTAGTRQPNAKLNDAKVAEILRALDGGKRPAGLAARYRVSETLIRSIRKGKLWKHVSRPCITDNGAAR